MTRGWQRVGALNKENGSQFLASDTRVGHLDFSLRLLTRRVASSNLARGAKSSFFSHLQAALFSHCPLSCKRNKSNCLLRAVEPVKLARKSQDFAKNGARNAPTLRLGAEGLLNSGAQAVKKSKGSNSYAFALSRDRMTSCALVRSRVLVGSGGIK